MFLDLLSSFAYQDTAFDGYLTRDSFLIRNPDEAREGLIQKAKVGGPLLRLLLASTVTNYGYHLRSGGQTVCKPREKTKRLSDFVTHKY